MFLGVISLALVLLPGCGGEKSGSEPPGMDPGGHNPPPAPPGQHEGEVGNPPDEAAPDDSIDSPRTSAMETSAEERFSKVEVFYATDRLRVEPSKPDQRYGSERNLEGDHLEYGKAFITIPETHTPGKIERPKWWKFEFRENPDKHVTVMEPTLMEEGEFYQSIHTTAKARPADEVLMFIHGFNVPWGHAMRRTGQISHDLGFGGVTFCYSWPSQGSLKKYPADKQNSDWTIPHLTKVLVDLQEKAKVGKIHVVAHSMGTRALSYAIANAKNSGHELNLSNIILAAPDIDRDIFAEQILPKIEGHTALLTMYASSDDEALKVSRSFNGSDRLGLSGNNIFVLPDRMDTVDASGIDTSLLGHSYYGSQQAVVKDIFGVIVEGLLPADRKLKPGDFGEWDLPLEILAPVVEPEP